MRVRALKLGIYGRRRKAGEEFDIEGEHQLGKWMEVIEEAPPPPKPKPYVRKKAPKKKSSMRDYFAGSTEPKADSSEETESE